MVSASDVPEFAKAIESMTSAADYAALRKRFGVLRSSHAFWAFSDRMHAAYRQAQPLESAMFDYNRLEGL